MSKTLKRTPLHSFLAKRRILRQYRRVIAEQRYIMHALGGIYGRYPYVDSADSMRALCERGYRLFEADVNLTADGVAVLAHRFAQPDYLKQLGAEHYDAAHADARGWYVPTLKEFDAMRLYGRFPTHRFTSLVEVMREYPDAFVMLDIGDIDYEGTRRLFEALLTDCGRDRCILDRLIAGGRTKEHLRAQRELYDFPLINLYFHANPSAREAEWATPESFVRSCRQIGATSFSTSKAGFTEEDAAVLSQSGLIPYVFTVNDVEAEEMMRARGARLIGTDYLREPARETAAFAPLRDLWQEKLVAVALGEIDRRYRNTNTLEAYRYSLSKGFRNFEADIRLTSDGELVCVDRWHAHTYEMLGIAYEEPAGGSRFLPPLSLEAFQSALYYGRFPTLRFDRLAQAVAPDLQSGKVKRLILGAGRPAPDRLAVMLRQLKKILPACGISSERLALRLERPADLAAVRQSGLSAELIYHLATKNRTAPEIERAVMQAVALCGRENIGWISLDAARYTPATAGLIRQAGLKVCLFTCLSADHIAACIELGADLIGAHSYGIEQQV